MILIYYSTELRFLFFFVGQTERLLQATFSRMVEEPLASIPTVTTYTYTGNGWYFKNGQPPLAAPSYGARSHINHERSEDRNP